MRCTPFGSGLTVPIAELACDAKQSLRAAIETHHGRRDIGGQLAACALPPGDPSDVQIQYVSDPSLTDRIALYEAAFGAHEPKTDFYEATALQVIASVLGFFEDEIELVP